MRLATKNKDAQFSCRMTEMERADLDTMAKRYDRPRAWVVRKLIRVFGGLERGREEGALIAEEKATLTVLRKAMRAPVLPADEGDGE